MIMCNHHYDGERHECAKCGREIFCYTKRISPALITEAIKTNNERILKIINDLIESVELAGYDNAIDESYHSALVTVRKLINQEKDE